jgi:hypothetical protein
VQPHLLFPGELLDNLATLVVNQQVENSGTDWRMAPPLAGDLGKGGPADQLLVNVVVDRARTALPRLASV